LNEPSRCYTQTQLGAFHVAVRKSVFYANVNADRRRFDRDGRNESPERSLRFQLGYRLGSGLRKQAFVKLVRRVRSPERPSHIRPRFKNLKTRSPGTEFLDAETRRQKSQPKSVNAGRDQNPAGNPRRKAQFGVVSETGGLRRPDGGDGRDRTCDPALGDYHKTSPIETFTASAADRHPTDLAGSRGARLVTSVETEEGRRWAESKIKSLTGGDRISARFMRQDFFEFTPIIKLVVAGNHKPGL
jgi:hypothetical protein